MHAHALNANLTLCSKLEISLVFCLFFLLEALKATIFWGENKKKYLCYHCKAQLGLLIMRDGAFMEV